jgi:hypothetical protein
LSLSSGRFSGAAHERTPTAQAEHLIILIGNLGRDRAVRNSQAGKKIVSFTLETSETWNGKVSGERQERTEWHGVLVFNGQIAGVAERFPNPLINQSARYW